jgi:hypothetical protein
MSNLAQLAPVFANLGSMFQKDDTVNPRDFYNTRRDKVASLMANRRVNVQPQLDEILGSEKTAYYNLRNSANSRGELQGNIAGIANTAMRNRSAVLANKQNADLGYMGQEAEALAGLGQQEASANWNAMDYNAATLANRRNIWRTGLSQLSQYSQMKELQGNQLLQDKNREKTLHDIFGSIAPWLKSLQNIQYSNT